MIKKLFFAAMLIMSSITIAQAQQLNYQGIARNANGVAISFQEVSIRLTIHDLIAAGPTLYAETRLVKTNQFGLINIVIGSGGAINTFGSLSGINWAGGSKFLQVEIDPLGGTAFQQAGTSQLQSVPYAFFASAAYPVGPAGGDLLGSTYPNPIIAPFAVTTTKLGDTAVTTRKIADSAVNTSKILNRAVTTEKIMDSAITTAKLRNKGVTNEKLADSVITTDKIKNGAITNEKIADGTIQNIKLVNSTITLNGLVLNLGGSQSFVVDSAGTDVNIASANSIHRFNFPNASIANRGLITPNTQTIGGNKIFNNNITAASFIKSGGIAAQFLKADGTVDNNIYLTANQPIIITATGDATGVSTSSGTAPVLPLTLATVNSTAGVFGTDIVIPSITVNTKGLITNVITNPIPTATSTTLGLLTSANWNTFNSKQNAIPLGTTAQYFRGDLSLSNFQADVRAQLGFTPDLTYANGIFGLEKNFVTLNGLQLKLGGSQTFATGTTGVDFNISPLGSVHTFNIPTASFMARGLLSSQDFINFSTAYSNRITSLTTTGTSGAATLSGNTLNIPAYTLNGLGGVPTTRTINGVDLSTNRTFSTTDILEGAGLYWTAARSRAQQSLTVTGNSGASTYDNITGVLNVPTYTLTGLGGVPTTRTINGVDLSANRTFSTTDILEGTSLYWTPSRSRAQQSLTVTGSNGASTYNSTTGILNVPTYTLTGLGGVSTTRTINGIDLSANQAFSTGTTGTDFNINSSSGTTHLFNIPSSSGTARGLLTSADYTSFTNKWGTSGNTGLTAANFLGTTDPIPLRFRVDNTWAGELNSLTSNTSLGFRAAQSTTALGNTAFGSFSLATNITGVDNTAIGSGALALSTGNNNTAVGQNALSANTSAGNNTAVGQAALRLVTGGNNTAMGRAALELTTTGTGNTAIGNSALINNTGSNNTAIGNSALTINISGTNNTAIGNGATANADNLTNATAIGAGATVDANNKVRIGNTAVTVIEGQVAYTFPSDKRFKYDIKENIPGLSFITKLRPVSYYFDNEKLDHYTKTGELKNSLFKSVSNINNKQILKTGFLAQDVEQAAKSINYNFDGVHKPENAKDHYSLAYSQFVVPLVKAVQEQQTIINSLEERIAALEKIIKEKLK